MTCFLIVEVGLYQDWFIFKLKDKNTKEIENKFKPKNNLIDIIENNIGAIIFRNMTYIHIKSQDHLIKTLIKSVRIFKYIIKFCNGSQII